MKILLDQQDIIDSICVLTAADANGGDIIDSEPELVTDIRLSFNGSISATSRIYGHRHNFNQKKIIDAIAVYMSEYYTVAADRMLINLQYDEPSNEFGAEIIVTR